MLIVDVDHQITDAMQKDGFSVQVDKCSQPLSNKFQIDVYFFEVYTHCEAPKLIFNKIEIHPFWDFPKLKLTHREEFPTWSSHQIEINTKWCPPSDPIKQPNYEVHPAVGELHLVDFNLMNIIC